MSALDLTAQFSDRPISILVRATNWIGDAIMTLPAVETIRFNFPKAKISVLSQPWVADIFSANPFVNQVIVYHKKTTHAGPAGMWRLSRELATHQFDLAILLQNAFEAALLARLARIPAIAGFNRDARGLLLTHPVPVTREIKSRHQVFYYQHLLASLGLITVENKLTLYLSDQDKGWAHDFVDKLPRPIIGLNPGAAYGPAKRWPAERYGVVARTVREQLGGTVLVFGTAADRDAAATIEKIAGEVIDLTGNTSLAQAMALIGRCAAFITNDSGLMHVAAAQNTPLVAIFGSTDALATGPFSERAVVVKKTLACSPCLKTHCPADFECMKGVTTCEVEKAVFARLRE